MLSREIIKEQARYIVDNQTTIRNVAVVFGVSKSTIHDDINKLQSFDMVLYLQVREVLEKNKAERHIRGGASTREKYRKMREKN